MIRKLFISLTAVAVMLSASGCGNKKAEEEDLQKKKALALESIATPKYNPPEPMPLPKDQKLEVPKDIKAKYRTVTMLVGDRKTDDIRKFKVKIGDTAAVPGTDYTVTVESYLPHWVFRGNTVTSLEDGPKDPAVRAKIYEKGKTEPVFDGYIFEKHATPSFITDKFAIGMGEIGRAHV